MREIKFRLWLGNKFHYWGFMERGFVAPAIISNINVTMEVAKENSQMFIGLLDKNGKEIYEGDVLLTISDMIVLSTGKKSGKVRRTKGEVVWSNDIPAFCIKENGRVSNFAMNPQLIKQYHEIVGNIYENPELK